MAQVLLEDITKIFDGNVKVVDKVNLEIDDCEFMVIVGPSGCGKTTTLRMIAGLEDVTEGKVSIGGNVVNDVLPKDRNIAMVFQNYALYPHMTVFQNMAFGLKLRKFPKAEINKRVEDAAELLGIGELLNRKPKALSGGQRQRVAVGRAIVRNPAAFLFDEPLSNLDAKLRVTMRAELKSLHRRLKTTSIYVTHDQAEAMTLGDRICVMYKGIIQQVDTPLEVYNKPVNRFVAGFLGTPPMNLFDGQLESKNGDMYFVNPAFQVKCSQSVKQKLSGYSGKNVVLGVRPENITTTPLQGQTENIIESTVDVIEPLGDRVEVYFSTRNNDQFIASIDPNIPVKIDDKMNVYISTDKFYLFEPGDTGKNLTLA